jgi:hypothetical protein
MGRTNTKRILMKKLIEKIILSDAFVKTFIYVCAIVFILIFTIQLV